MTIWKPAILGAVLAVAACQPVGAMGEQRVAAKLADAMLTDQLIVQFVRQEVQGMMQTGAVSQDQVNQIGMTVSREMQNKLPEAKKTLVASLTKEFNIKELDLFLKLLTSKEGMAISSKNEAVMTDVMTQLSTLAKDATLKAVSRVNSAWPTGGRPPPPAQTQLPPDGMQLPN